MVTKGFIQEMESRAKAVAKTAGVVMIKAPSRKGLPLGVALRLREDFWLLHQFGSNMKIEVRFEVPTKKEALAWLRGMAEQQCQHRLGPIPDGPLTLADGSRIKIVNGAPVGLDDDRKATYAPPDDTLVQATGGEDITDDTPEKAARTQAEIDRIKAKIAGLSNPGADAKAARRAIREARRAAAAPDMEAGTEAPVRAPKARTPKAPAVLQAPIPGPMMKLSAAVEALKTGVIPAGVKASVLARAVERARNGNVVAIVNPGKGNQFHIRAARFWTEFDPATDEVMLVVILD